MISDLDGSLGSRHFLNGTVANERTCFVLCACTFKSPGLITCFFNALVF